MFFVTIVMVTAGGRAAVAGYARQTMSLFTTQLPYSHVALAFMALSALGCIMLLCRRSPEQSSERWVWREVRSDPCVGKHK